MYERPKKRRPSANTIQAANAIDCHAPVVNYASEELAQEIGRLVIVSQTEKDKPVGQKAEEDLSKLNVGCLSCHNMKAIAVARGLRGDPELGTVYGPKGSDSGGAHKTVGTPDITRSVFCMQCHGKPRKSTFSIFRVFGLTVRARQWR